MKSTPDQGKTFKPVKVTEALRKQYEALSMSDGQADKILVHATTRIFLNGGSEGGGQGRAQG